MADEQTDLDVRLAELVEIRERLAECTDPGERQSLRDRQHELRSHSTHDELERMPVERLAALERNLVAQRDDKLKQRFDIGAAGAGGRWSDGLDPVALMEQNRQTDEASGIAVVEQRLQEVRSELARRADEP